MNKRKRKKKNRKKVKKLRGKSRLMEKISVETKKKLMEDEESIDKWPGFRAKTRRSRFARSVGGSASGRSQKIR